MNNKCEICQSEIEDGSICDSASCRREYHKKQMRNKTRQPGIKYKIQDMEKARRRLFEKNSTARNYRWRESNKKFIAINEIAYEVLRQLDESTRMDAEDIYSPGNFMIKFNTENGNSVFLPDIYIESLDLIISCKDLSTANQRKYMQEFRTVLNDFDHNYIMIDSLKAAKDIPNIIKKARRFMESDDRYIVPPRINALLISESFDVRLKESLKLNYLVVLLNDKEKPVAFFLAKDILKSNKLFHIENRNIVIVDGSNIIEDEKILLQPLYDDKDSIDLIHIMSYLSLMQNPTMIDLLKYHYGMPIDFEKREAIEKIIERFGGLNNLTTINNYRKSFEEKLQIKEDDNDSFTIELGGGKEWEMEI